MSSTFKMLIMTSPLLAFRNVCFFVTGAPLPRDFKADVLFVVDSSQSVSKEKFLRELDFVKAFARTLDISPDKSRVGVVTFGNTPTHSIRFEEYTNIQSFSRGVDVVPYIAGPKRLDKALVFAARILSKARPNVKKMLVVLTDGKQPLARDPLDASAKPLHQLGVKISVIGAGGNVSVLELSKITSEPGDLFFSRTFGGMVLQVPAFYDHMIYGTLKNVFQMPNALKSIRCKPDKNLNLQEVLLRKVKALRKVDSHFLLK